MTPSDIASCNCTLTFSLEILEISISPEVVAESLSSNLNPSTRIDFLLGESLNYGLLGESLYYGDPSKL